MKETWIWFEIDVHFLIEHIHLHSINWRGNNWATIHTSQLVGPHTKQGYNNILRVKTFKITILLYQYSYVPVFLSWERWSSLLKMIVTSYLPFVALLTFELFVAAVFVEIQFCRWSFLRLKRAPNIYHACMLLVLCTPIFAMNRTFCLGISLFMLSWWNLSPLISNFSSPLAPSILHTSRMIKKLIQVIKKNIISIIH